VEDVIGIVTRSGATNFEVLYIDKSDRPRVKRVNRIISEDGFFSRTIMSVRVLRSKSKRQWILLAALNCRDDKIRGLARNIINKKYIVINRLSGFSDRTYEVYESI
jgi:hypothetical protein